MGKYHSQARFFEYVPREPGNEQVARPNVCRRVLPNAKHTDLPATRTTGELAAVVDVYRLAGTAQSDAARKKRATAFFLDAGNRVAILEILAADFAEFEDIGVLEEKDPSFREEQAEPGQVDLPCIDTGTGKVRIHGQRRRH